MDAGHEVGPSVTRDGGRDSHGFCPACLRWALPESRPEDQSGVSCARCGATSADRYLSLLTRSAAASAEVRTRHVVGLALSDPLDLGLRAAGMDVLRVATVPGPASTPDWPRGAIPRADGAAPLVVWTPPAGSPDALEAWLSELTRVLSPAGESIVGGEPADGAAEVFGDAGFEARRVTAAHVLPMPGLAMTSIEPGESAWLLRRLPAAGGTATAVLAARMEAHLFAAVTGAAVDMEATRQHLEAVAAAWERAYGVTRRRRALRAADAARSFARRLAGRPPGSSSVRLPPAPLPPRIDAVGMPELVHDSADPPSTAQLAGARPAGDLPAVSPRADALLGCQRGATEPRVRLVLHEFNEDRVFAGIRTALVAAAALARTLDLPLTVLLLQEPNERRSIGTLVDWFRDEVPDPRFADSLRIASIERDSDEAVHADDVWMLTYWTTAVAAARAVRAGVLDPRRAVYLVQDYEPGFFGWSDESAMAATTYQQGFHHLVNSRPLARYLADYAGVSVPPDQVFAPAVDNDLVHRAAAAWRPDPEGRLRVLFYGRPRHPRNLFRIGLESLRLWTETLDVDSRPRLLAAGADHPAYRMARDLVLEPLGKLSLDGYADLLSRTDLTLALMFSPHPGHLSLESPAAGIPTVTNRFGSYREPWLERLHLAEPNPDDLAQALVDAAREARGIGAHAPQRLPDTLGVSLDEAIRAVAARLSRPGPADGLQELRPEADAGSVGYAQP